MMVFRNAIAHFSVHPRRLFLIDAIGAAVSALLMAFVLVKHAPIFGIPKPALYLLASLPCAFGCFDVLCFFLCKNRFKICLLTIAILNFSYCVVSVAVASCHCDSLTVWGGAYVFAEVLIVGALARFEWYVGKKRDQ